MPTFQYDYMKKQGAFDGGQYYICHLPATQIRPASHLCVLLSSVAVLPVSLCSPLLSLLRAPGLQVRSLSVHYRWA